MQKKLNWDLSDLYKSGDDPQLVKDKMDILSEAEAFALKYKGRIAQLEISEFKTMLQDYEELQDKGGKIGSLHTYSGAQIPQTLILES